MAFEDMFRISVHAVITDEDNRILQLKSTYGNKSWGLPGGALEPGESIHQALARECQEELGCPVEILYMSGMYYHKAYNSQVGIFRCQIINGPIALSHEHSEFRYFNFDELSTIQQRRVGECLNFNGQVFSAVF